MSEGAPPDSLPKPDEPVFRKLWPKSPPTMNHKGPQKRRFRDAMDEWKREIVGFPVFDPTVRLFGRIVYFNHHPATGRDIHNVLKPLLDCLQGIVYADDKSIVQFEGVRLDMHDATQLFEYEIANDGPSYEHVTTGTCCWIEIGRLPSTIEPSVKVSWSP